MADFEWEMEREAAQSVLCPDCYAPPGHTCTRTDPFTGKRVPVTRMPAHSARIAAADRAHTQGSNQ